MNRRSAACGDQIQGLLMHGENLLDRVEERTVKLHRLPAGTLNILLGVCLGMLIAYAIHIRLAVVEFNIVGPLMGGAGGALANLLGRDFGARRREERLRLEKLEAASRLQMAVQVVDFLRSQGRLLPEDVKDGAWSEVSRLVSSPKVIARASTPALLANLMPHSTTEN